MDNYDILKFKTFHNYNFDDIESSEFLDLFYKLVNETSTFLTIGAISLFISSTKELHGLKQ